MPEPKPTIESVFQAVDRAGLAPRGAFRLGPDERVGALANVQTIALIGIVGRRGWEAFAASPEARDGGGDPLDRFSRRVIDGLAEELGVIALYPFGGAPHWPFQRWAQRAEPVHPSPLGLMIHPRYGLALPEVVALPSPCDSCREKPCLAACPVGAFTGAGYDVPACAAHLGGPAGGDCMGGGCLARRACPVGSGHVPESEQAAFAMRAFLRARQAPA